MKPVIFGLSGLVLTEDEKRLFREVEPAGYILFKRNIEDRAQILALTNSLRELHGHDLVPILIDQEGGRVARMRGPTWPDFPAGAAFDALYDLAPMTAIEAARCNAEAIALTLNEVGINVDCLPVLDVRVPETHSAIGDRAVSSVWSSICRGKAAPVSIPTMTCPMSPQAKPSLSKTLRHLVRCGQPQWV